MRKIFEKQLQKLTTLLNEMSFLCEDIMELTEVSLKKLPIAEDMETMIDLKKELRAKKVKGENLCLKLLLKQQPVARDLQFVSSAIQVFNNLERIGEQSIEIFMLIDRPIEQFMLQSLQIEQMAQVSKQMLHKTMSAYLQNDIPLAKEVILLDDTVDRFFAESKETLLQNIQEDKTFAESALDCMLIVKYYEKISDHSVNIARLTSE